MYHQNNYIRRILILLIFITTFSKASYHSIYNIYDPQFNYTLEDKNYKVYLQEEGMIDYQKKEGFKFFLPNYTKEFNLSILRFNSIGLIDGFLSSKKFYSKDRILDVNRNDLKYYTTDYKANFKQLNYLQSNKVIPYKNETSLLIEAINIPLKKSYKLNDWFYFGFDKKNLNNKLKYLVYSYYIILDKKYVDSYVKKYFKKELNNYNDEFKYIRTYVKNLSQAKKVVKTKNSVTKTNDKVAKTKVKQTPKKTKRLNLSRFLFMKEFGYITKEHKKDDIDIEKIDSLLKKLQNKEDLHKLSKLSSNLNTINYNLSKLVNKNSIDTHIDDLLDISSKIDSELYRLSKMGTIKSLGMAFDEKKYDSLKVYFDELEKTSDNIKFETYNSSLQKDLKFEIDKIVRIKQELIDYENEIYIKRSEYIKAIKQLISNDKKTIVCNELDEQINSECLANKIYVNNYIYRAIKRNKLPNDEFILEYEDGKIINDVAKYYFEIGEYEKSEKFLNKAISLLSLEDKKIAIFNLGVLNGKLNTKNRNQKSVELFKKLKFKEAYFNIAVNYYIGLGIKENDRLAFYYFKKASDLGLSRAKNNFDIMKNKYSYR